MWRKGKKEINNISQFPKDCFGFVYKVKHIQSGKCYIGKKFLWFNRKQRIGKRERALWEGVGRPPTFKIVTKESDWKNYYGSHTDITRIIKNDGVERFSREILEFARNKKHLTYLECKYLFKESVLEDENYYNDNILGKFFQKDLVNLN